MVELLIVISIIALLIGMLLPAVQKVRESANLVNCANNLKQIGLALQSYHNAEGSFPPGYISDFDSYGNDTGPGWGWTAKLLPHMEQGPLNALIRYDLPIEAPANLAARTTPVKNYLCPSDTVPSTWTASQYDLVGNPTGAICDVASANYTAVFGVGEPGVDGEGLFFRNSKVTIAEITDGTSQTLAVGERWLHYGPATWVGAVTNASTFPAPSSPANRIVGNAATMVLGHSFEGPPNAPGLDLHNFSSAHVRGGNFVFADGHVSLINSTMKIATFRALSTRASGEAIDGEY